MKVMYFHAMQKYCISCSSTSFNNIVHYRTGYFPVSRASQSKAKQSMVSSYETGKFYPMKPFPNQNSSVNTPRSFVVYVCEFFSTCVVFFQVPAFSYHPVELPQPYLANCLQFATTRTSLKIPVKVFDLEYILWSKVGATTTVAAPVCVHEIHYVPICSSGQSVSYLLQQNPKVGYDAETMMTNTFN
jgi:hypothetical protein